MVDRVEAIEGVVAIRGGAPCDPELDASVPTTGVQYLRGSGPGRIVVKSAGNDRGLPVHAEVFATPAGVTATVSVSGSANGLDFSVDGYYKATDRLRVKVTTPSGTIIGPLSVNAQNAPWPGQYSLLRPGRRWRDRPGKQGHRGIHIGLRDAGRA